jgi:uncharacterized membrane protein YhaH (DUF805 family)
MDNSYTSNAFLFSFEGRINRAKYWYAAFASMAPCLVFLAVLASVLGGIFGAGVKSVHVAIYGIYNIFKDPPSLPFGANFSDAGPASPVSLLFYTLGTPIFLTGIWFLTATTLKRLHDRNKSGWWIAPFFFAPSLLNKLSDWLDDPTLAQLLSALAFGLNVWCFVELFCLRGTNGPNRFGPDPLAPVDTRPGWEQQSELESVPHSAGPSAGA